MNATEAFTAFVTRVLVPAKARRFSALASSRKGQRKVLDELCHEFDPAIRETAIRTKNYSSLWEKTCYVFHTRLGFGTEFPKVRDAYDELSFDDSWLIVLQDASAGIHRPESRWDDEKLIAG
jgi:hypothetical protein